MSAPRAIRFLRGHRPSFGRSSVGSGRQTAPQGVLVAIWSPRGRFVTATGFADLATRRRLKSDMQFKIASQTKTFTANLILLLVGEGKVALDDRIAKWIAGVPNGHRITIRQILNHTSGLGDGFNLPAIQAKLATGCTVDELLTVEATAPPVAAPGATWSYSNYGYNLLGRVVELATGQDLSTRPRGCCRRPSQNASPHLGQRAHRTLHPRLREWRGLPDTGAQGLGRRHCPAGIVPVGPRWHGLHALRHARLVPGPCDRCTPQAGRVEGGEEGRGPVRVRAELQRTRAMEVRPGVRRVRWIHRRHW